MTWSEASVAGDLFRAQKAARTGDDSQAAALMHHALSSTDETEPVHYRAGWTVYVHPGFSGGACFVDRAAEVVVLGREMWLILESHLPAVDHLLTQAREGAEGMRFLTTDAGPYAEAARIHARAAGNDLVRAKDVLLDAEARMRRLLTTVSGLQGELTTEVQRRVVFEDYGSLKGVVDDASKRVFDLQAQLDLVGTLLSTLD